MKENIKTKPVNLYIPEELWRRVKSVSALQGKTVSQFVIETLKDKIKDGQNG